VAGAPVIVLALDRSRGSPEGGGPGEVAAMVVEQKLQALGMPVPDLEQEYRQNVSGAHFISHYALGQVLYLSGTVPIKDGKPFNPGVLGKDLTIEQGYAAARWALLASLSAVKYALGDLDRVQQVIQMIGYVNAAPGFADPPRVINGAADLLVELYGDRGRPTRAAIGCQGLALNSSVEVILTLLFSGTEIRPPLARDRWQK
jgi:enamine deaminase RidA (YjgF/YER057c/UK114 family)